MKKRVLPIIFSLVILVSSAANVPGIGASENYGLRLLSSDENGVTLELLTPQVPLEEVLFEGEGGVERSYQRIALSGAEVSSQAGKPQLPVVTALLGVPPDADIELRVLADESIQLAERVNLLPAPSPAPSSEELQPGRLVWEPDPAAYASRELYPQAPAELSEVAWVRDRRVVRVELYPFQILPAEGRLTWHKLLRVELRFTGAKMGLQAEALEEDAFDALLKDELLNYREARHWRAAPPISRERLAALNNFAPASGDSPEVETPRYKISISEDGIYRLDYATLQEAGLPVETIQPETFKLTSQGQEVALWFDGDNDDIFEPGEALLFFGEKFRGERLADLYQYENDNWYTYSRHYSDGSIKPWKAEVNALILEKYTDENVYWLSYGGEAGLRMALTPAIDPSITPSPISSYRAVQRFEKDELWVSTHFAGEETLFWRRIQGGATSVFAFTISGLVSDSGEAKIWGEMTATTYNPSINPDHHTVVRLNEEATSFVDETWDGRSRFSFEGSFPQSWLKEGENEIKVQVKLIENMTADYILFDWFAVEYERHFQAVGDSLDFKTPESGPWRYAISGFTGSEVSDYAALQVSDPASPLWIADLELDTSVLSFVHQGEAGERLYAGKIRDLESSQLSLYTPPALSPAEYVIISPTELLDGARELAAYREAKGLTTLVVELQSIYDEFNFGIRHPLAIKNFLATTFDTDFWDQPPTYVVLLGDGHWNFKNDPLGGFSSSRPNLMPPYMAWVDPWQGEVDSANLLAAVTMDPLSGTTDPMPDVLIGRIPVNNPEELEVVIEKIKKFETPSSELWRKRILFVADDQDEAGDFKAISEALIGGYFLNSDFMLSRVYGDELLDEKGNPDGGAFRDLILEEMNQGALLVNYHGHGSISNWAGVFTATVAEGLTNGDRTPVVLSMTCMDGMWAYFKDNALAEVMLRSAGKGWVASFSPTGLGLAGGHDQLNRGFFDYLLFQDEAVLGEAALAAKLRLYRAGHDYDLLHTYTVFGDPALDLDYMDLSNPYLYRLGLPLIWREVGAQPLQPDSP